MNKSLIIVLILFSCSSSKKVKNPETVQNSKSVVNTPLGAEGFDIQGHRGCRGLMPENTIAAMTYALGFFKLTTLEMDVAITKDKKVILSHEPWMSAEITTKPDGSFITKEEERKFNIYRMTYEEVKKFDVGMKPHPQFPNQQKIKAYKPSLHDMLDGVAQFMMTARRPPPFFNIEIKSNPAGDDIYHPKPAEFVELLMAVIKEKNLEEQVIIQSFDFRPLRYLREKYPVIKLGMLINENDKRSLENQLKDLGFTPVFYNPAYQLVNESLVKQCHDKNIKIIPWTVNTKVEIEKLRVMGVDGIITDYPDLF